jgi:hypothetical protein
MSSKLIVTNLSRIHEYQVILNGRIADEVFPLQSVTVEIPPGEYALSFKESEEAELPTMCKSIDMVVEEGKEFQLSVTTKNFSIQIYDGQGTQLNGKSGFLCGYVADGVHVDNPIA